MSNFDNPFDLRRFANLASPRQQSPLQRAYRGVTFGPTVLQGQEVGAASQEEDPVTTAINRMHGGKATEAYRQHLETLPQQGDYEPSKWRRLGAALTAGAASFGRQPQNAMELGAQVRDAPYRGALENWQLKGAGLKEQAGLEAVDQTAQLARLKEILNYKDKQTDNERLDRAQKSTEAYQNARISALRQQGWKDFTDEKGNLILYNPNTGERQSMGPTAKAVDMQNDATRLGYEGQRVGFEGERTKQGASNTAANWARVGQAERGLGLEDRRTAATEKNATTNATNSGYVAPGTNDAAQTSAARNVVAKHPEFAQYLDDKGFVKLPADYKAPWYKGGGRATPPDPTTDDNYSAFLSMVEAEKKRVLNTRRPGASSTMFSFDDLPE